MMPYVYLALIVVFIVDLSGFSDTVCDLVSRLTHKHVVEFKPFTCSLCMTWWSGLALAILRGEFTLQVIAFVALLAFLSFPMSRLIILLSDGIIKIIKVFEKWTS